MKKDITTALVTEHRLIMRMLDVLERAARLTASGEYHDYGFYLKAVDFIRNYADRFHHAKEEDVLFAALVANGMPQQNSPVAAMLMEHDLGRGFVKAMEEAAQKALAGIPGQEEVLAANAHRYAELLREHIAKEDQILYPLAERLVPEAQRDELVAAYAAAEGRTPAGFAETYEAVVALYEIEFSAAA